MRVSFADVTGIIARTQKCVYINTRTEPAWDRVIVQFVSIGGQTYLTALMKRFHRSYYDQIGNKCLFLLREEILSHFLAVFLAFVDYMFEGIWPCLLRMSQPLLLTCGAETSGLQPNVG